MCHYGNNEAMSLICCDTLTDVTKVAIKECPQVYTVAGMTIIDLTIICKVVKIVKVY